MNPGRFRHRVTLVSSTVTPDGLGGGSRTAANVATVWAIVESASRKERRVADALRGQVSHIITIRYPQTFTVSADMRVTWQGRTFVVKSVVEPDLIPRWLELHCMEGE